MLGKIKMSANEHVFSTIFLVLTAGLTWFSIVNDMQSMQVIALMLLRVSLFLSIGSVFVKFLNGFGFDMNKEIFVDNNPAAAIFIAGFWIGLAIALSSAL